ncbi:hypothetical protein E1A91_D03G078500v1 [Gossypium mustelinum]|uniref:Uncharacterized protein n=1 Tax=Gossypium mustelinum TaxID=34275 RepID=A0A5D2VKM6_GOSMU|nr:hypothetical protein E1A91_D03G078500v1 [Gossypium mustelinum]
MILTAVRATRSTSLTLQWKSLFIHLVLGFHEVHFAHRMSLLTNYLEIQNLDTLDSDTDKMKLKLQELERALPADNDVYEEVDMFGAGLSMEIDGEWSDPIGTDQSLHDSHKESSSSDSYHSSISSNKEVSHASSKIPKQMLIHCAAVLSDMFCW